MKKIITVMMALLLCLGMILSAVSCASILPGQDGNGAQGNQDNGTGDGSTDDGTTEDTGVSVKDFDPKKTYLYFNYFELDMSEYVQLGRYQNLSITIDPKQAEINEATVQTEIYNFLQENHPDAKITNRPVAMGDKIVMDYVGKLDGVAFSGGTVYSTTIEVQEKNGFIPGFVDGMIGLTPGVMTEVPVTFPEDYKETSLAGKAVIFEMTVHYIVGEPELTDDFVAEYTEGEMTTAEEYTASVRKELETAAYNSLVRAALWTKIRENAVVLDYPADAIMYFYSYYYSMYSQYAAMCGATYEQMLSLSGMTPSSLFEYCKTTMVRADLVRHAVYQAGGYTCPDEKYQELLDEYTEANYEALRASMIASGEEEYTKEQAREYFDQHYKNELIDTCLDEIVTAALRENLTIVEQSTSTGSGSTGSGS